MQVRLSICCWDSGMAQAWPPSSLDRQSSICPTMDPREPAAPARLSIDAGGSNPGELTAARPRGGAAGGGAGEALFHRRMGAGI